jgi:2'-5' RNA ligase
LQDRIERACQTLGYAVEGRPFRPHITLGRVQEGEWLPPNALARFSGEYEIAFLADRLQLLESRPGRGGSQYLTRQTIALAPCPVV